MKGYKVSDRRMELGDGGWPDDSTAGWKESGPFPEHVITRRGITRGNILNISLPSAWWFWAKRLLFGPQVSLMRASRARHSGCSHYRCYSYSEWETSYKANVI